VSLTDDPGKEVLFAWHPLSWHRPHMALYEDRRYYRRGNFRAVPMRERDVEAAYASRRSSAEQAIHFLNHLDRIILNEPGIHMTVCPHCAPLRPIDVLRPSFRAWLLSQRPCEYPGSWVPFGNGWHFQPRFGLGYSRPLEMRLFNNGALSCSDGIRQAGSAGADRLALSLLGGDINRRLFAFGNLLWEQLRISGPATARIELTAVAGWSLLGERPWSGGEAKQLPMTVCFDEETSIGEIRFSPGEVLGRLLDRVAAAAGRWRDCFSSRDDALSRYRVRRSSLLGATTPDAQRQH